jgi:hypothetical protein
VTQKRLEDMFQLLNLWQGYVDVIYAPESVITAQKIAQEKGAVDGVMADDLSFAAKMENENVESRLATLFSEEVPQEDDDESNIDHPYVTVNEGLTTDTSMTTDTENAEAESTATGKLGSDSSDQEEAGGIVSSEDEATVPGSSPKEQSSLFNSSEMFANEKLKDAQEHMFNFGDQDVDKFEQRM